MTDIELTDLILENDILFSSMVEKIGINNSIELFKKGLDEVEQMFNSLYEEKTDN